MDHVVKDESESRTWDDMVPSMRETNTPHVKLAN